MFYQPNLGLLGEDFSLQLRADERSKQSKLYEQQRDSNDVSWVLEQCNDGENQCYENENCNYHLTLQLLRKSSTLRLEVL